MNRSNILIFFLAQELSKIQKVKTQNVLTLIGELNRLKLINWDKEIATIT